jgi:cell division initiation protein
LAAEIMFDPDLSKRRDSADMSGQSGSVRDTAAGQPRPSATGVGAPRGMIKMNVSPLDLRQQKFHARLRGYDRVEVTSFLAAVADDYEAALRETDKLRQELMRMEAMLSEYRLNESNLKSTLMTAQKIADDIKANAHEEARLIVQEAESRSDLLLEKTQARLEDVQREIDGLRLKRRDVETSIESTIQTLRNTLEYVREQEARERDEKILLHRPRHAADLPAVETHEARKVVG